MLVTYSASTRNIYCPFQGDYRSTHNLLDLGWRACCHCQQPQQLQQSSLCIQAAQQTGMADIVKLNAEAIIQAVCALEEHVVFGLTHIETI